MVKLIWNTPNGEKLIAYCARVSSNNQDNPDYEKLIKYLIKNKHWSPFEMANMCVEIETTKGIASQILRHRSFSFQEFSQRYSEVKDIDIPDFRAEHPINRQSSTDEHKYNDGYKEKVNELYKQVFKLYHEMLNDKVAKESARFILPLSTKTRMYMSGSIRSWIHYLQIRLDHHTQKEHRDIAYEILQIFKNEYPTIYNAVFTKDNY